MSGLDSVNGQIANARSRVFRRCFIKRRLLGTGLHESEWFEVSTDVVKWGTIKKDVDASKVNSFKFSNFAMTFSNNEGKYNPHDDENSYWYQYGDQQRTLVKIESGFRYDVLGSDGVWNNAQFPGDSEWDNGTWDSDGDEWDGPGSITFMGFIWGDINITGTNQVQIPVVPLTECFRQFAATRLSGWNNSLTASGFMEMVRDQVDVAGAYIFRPFFDDTATNWVIQTTTVQYTQMDSATAEDISNSTVWDIMETLAGSENMIPYPTTDGIFQFTSRDYLNTTSVYSFYGPGGFSTLYGTTIKQIKYYGFRLSKYYSRVRVQWNNTDTTTSYGLVESDYRVRGDCSSWTLGERTLDIANFWIPNQTVAEDRAQALFDEYSAAKKEIEFTTTFVPGLELLDRIDITYDGSQPSAQSSWDLYDWAAAEDNSVPTVDDLIFDNSAGDAIKLVQKEFKLISIAINLDTCECTFIGRE